MREVPERLDTADEVNVFFDSMTITDLDLLVEVLKWSHKARPERDFVPGRPLPSVESLQTPLLGNLRRSTQQVSQRARVNFSPMDGFVASSGWMLALKVDSQNAFHSSYALSYVKILVVAAHKMGPWNRPKLHRYVHRPKVRWGLLQPLRIVEGVPEEWRQVTLEALRNGMDLESALTLPGPVTARDDASRTVS